MNAPMPRIGEIKRVVIEFYDLPPAVMNARQRHRKFSNPRQIAMYFSRCLTANSTTLVGKLFGKRHHTTVIHACRAVSARSARNVALQIDLDRIERLILQAAGQRLSSPSPSLRPAPDTAQAICSGSAPAPAAFSRKEIHA